MLLQSHGGVIELLPALPKAWPDGSISGLCARGGRTVELTWKAGELVHAEIDNPTGKPMTVRYRGTELCRDEVRRSGTFGPSGMRK